MLVIQLLKSDGFPITQMFNGVHTILLELIKKLQTRNIHPTLCLLHFSTDEVYGDIEEGEHIEERYS
jgi:dTDP-D-glucose 4,6-dehydratase